jgi:hypothetical protein
MDENKRTTSAGYRFPLSKSRPRSSDYHKTCVPAHQKAAAVQAGESKFKESEYSGCDAVTQDTIWKQSVEVEKKGAEQW